MTNDQLRDQREQMPNDTKSHTSTPPLSWVPVSIDSLFCQAHILATALEIAENSPDLTLRNLEEAAAGRLADRFKVFFDRRLVERPVAGYEFGPGVAVINDPAAPQVFAYPRFIVLRRHRQFAQL